MSKIQSEKLKRIKSKYFPEEKKTSYIIIAVFVWASWVTLGAIRNNYQLQRSVDDLQEKIANLQIENDRLEFSNEFFDTDEYLELAARRDLGKIGKGEKLLIIPQRDQNFVSNGVGQIIETGDNRSNFAQWVDFLFSVDL